MGTIIMYIGGWVPGTESQKKDFVPGPHPPIYTIIMYIGGWVPGTESQKKRFCARDPTANIYYYYVYWRLGPGHRISKKKILCQGPNRQYILLLCILAVGSRAP